VPPRHGDPDPSDAQGATETYVRDGVPRPAPLGAIVRVHGAAAKPATFTLGAGTCVIGSAPACDIVISEPTVSRMHVELSSMPEGVSVRDLGSRNGVFYLGQRVEKMVLGFGGRLDVGAVRVTIDADTGALAEPPQYEGDTYRGVVGASAAMRRLFAVLSRLEGSLVTVLIEGESGAGKEVVARALHEGSPVQAGPLVTVNCGAIPHDLVASELFGHKKGAFTGALDSRRGAFDAADGGTLFLDEIGELPLDVQPVLLRALESGEVRPVGGDQTHTVRVRLIAATNRDLEREIEAGTFREDLFYRLAVVRLKVPALRERPEDVEPTARHFAAALGLADLPPDVIEQLKARAWPGNARELRNAIQAYAALGVLPEASRAKTAMLDAALRELVDTTRPYAAQKDELNDRFTRIYLLSLLERAGGNQTVAARMAGLDRTYLGRLLAKYQLPK
jgi:DNA-binding NtrC family response regulator